MTDPKRPAIVQDPESWEAGHAAGLRGAKPHQPPGTRDGLAWISGYIEGKADRAKPPEERKPHTRRPEPL
jgi:hypothetical protein